MVRFVNVARVDEIRPGSAVQVWIDENPVAIFNLDGEFYATSDVCTHEEWYLQGGAIGGEEVSGSALRAARGKGILQAQSHAKEHMPATSSAPPRRHADSGQQEIRPHQPIEVLTGAKLR